MRVLESLRMALRSLAANKMRAGLTMLGIMIGTGAVIALLSVGEGAQAAITDQIQAIGSNLIFVIPGQIQSGGTTTLTATRPLTLEDAEALADSDMTEYVGAVAPEINRTATITYRGESVTIQLVASTAEYEFVRNSRVDLGAFFSSADDLAGARVAVLGVIPAENLFGDAQSSLNQEIRINGVPFHVIGVLEEKGGAGFGNSLDNTVIVPISTAQRRLFSGRYLSDAGSRVDLINISAVDEASIDLAIDEVSWVLRQRHGILFGEDDFTIASQQDVLGVFNQVTSVLTIFLGAIAGISLLVGGIGIMNIMLVSVTERTREIGIRKAVGAKRSDILWQFLIESVVLSVVGGLVGIGLGWAIAAFVDTLDAFSTVVSPNAVLLAVSFSLVVGLFFGIYPASRASNLNPIEALRYE